MSSISTSTAQGILRGEMTLDDAGDALLDITLRAASGRLTAESLGHREFVLTKLIEVPRPAATESASDDKPLTKVVYLCGADWYSRCIFWSWRGRCKSLVSRSM